MFILWVRASAQLWKMMRESDPGQEIGIYSRHPSGGSSHDRWFVRE